MIWGHFEYQYVYEENNYISERIPYRIKTDNSLFSKQNLLTPILEKVDRTEDALLLSHEAGLLCGLLTAFAVILNYYAKGAKYRRAPLVAHEIQMTFVKTYSLKSINPKAFSSVNNT